MSASPAPEPYHSLGKGPVESRLTHRLNPRRWLFAAVPATLNPAHRTCTSRRIGIVRQVSDGGEDGRAAAVELRSRKKKGAGVGAPRRMHIHSARGISNNGALVGDNG
jgi:hypothetical protein